MQTKLEKGSQLYISMILHGEYIVTEQFKLWQIAPSNIEENNPWLCPSPTITRYSLHLILLQETNVHVTCAIII